MDLTSILGLIVGIGAVLLGATLEGLGPSALIQPTAFMIVIIGTVGAVVLCHRADELVHAGQWSLKCFLGSGEKPLDIAKFMIGIAQKARKEGILALQNDIKDIKDPFMRKGMELMTDGTDPHLLRDLLETELGMFEEEITHSAKVLEDFGALAPCVGIIGAVLGLIHVMSNLNDPSKLGGGIAVAFVATVYGVGAANLICLPMAGKIKFKGKASILVRQMTIEAVLSIQAGESPNFIKEKLKVFLSSKEAAELAEL
ncbi:MAG: flagellar motor protein [Vampirovibrionales bacterium]